jgi:hypothetical protein
MLGLARVDYAIVALELLVDVPKRPWYCPRRDHWRNLFDAGAMPGAGLLEHAVLVLVRGGNSSVAHVMRGALAALYPGSRLQVPQSEAREEARYLGYLDRKSRPRSEALVHLEPAFAETVSRWDTFRTREAGLYEAIAEACQAGRRDYAATMYYD